MKKIFLLITICLANSSVFAQRVLTQDSCRILARLNAEEIQKSQNAVTEASYTYKNAQTSVLPSIDGSANMLFMFPDIDISGSDLIIKGTYTAGITLTQPLYTGGKISTGIKLAKAGQECAGLLQKKTTAEVIAEVDNSYFTCIAVREKIKMLEQYLLQVKHLEDVVQQSIDAEMSTQHDLMRVKAKRSELEYNLAKAKNGYNLCRMALANAIGADFNEEIIPADTVLTVEIPADFSADISQRPEIQLLEKQVEIKERQIQMQRSDALPIVAVSAGYTYCGNIKMEGVAQGPDGNYYPYSQKFDQGMTMIMLTAQVPLFHWGQNSRNVKKAKLEAEDARLDLKKNSKLLSIETSQAVQNLTDGYSMVLTAQLGLSESEENLRIATDKYENQMSTLTDLLDAQSQWQQSFSNLIEAQTQYKIYQTEYLKKTGRLE